MGILRRDALEVVAGLPSWEFFEAKAGVLKKLQAGKMPTEGVNSLWSRTADSSMWELELLLDESVDDSWIFRREPTIRRPLATVSRHSADGIPYLAPEIQLLYKARSPRPQDEADFANVAPRLDSEARAWLRGALEKSEPGHRWLSVLERRR